MKVGHVSWQSVLPKQVTKGKSPVPLTEEEINPVQQIKDSKQALKELAQRQIAEIQEARTNMGKDDPKAQRLIEKFKNGKKLTPDEMAYVRKNAPGMVDYIDRITREREVIELSMKMAPTKSDVQMVAFQASKQIEKHQNAEEREIRAKHLADAKHEYEQTDEYKEKPNSPLDTRSKPTNIKYKKKPQQSTQLAKIAYEQLKPNKKETTIQYDM